MYRHVLPAIWGQTEALRRSDYFRTLAMGAAGAKELRVFGLADWTVARLREAWLGGMAPVWQAPVAFVSTFPARALTRGADLWLLLGGLAAAVGAVAVVSAVWQAGLRRYTGATS